MKKQITLLLTFLFAFAFNVMQTQAQVKNVLYINQVGVEAPSGSGASIPGDDPITRMLSSDSNFTVSYVEIDQQFNVTKVGANNVGSNAVGQTINFSGFDLIIASDSMASSNDIFKDGNPLHIDELTVPVIYSKTFAFRGGYVDAADGLIKNTDAVSLTNGAKVTETQNLSVTVLNTADDMFSGIDFTGGNEVQLFRTTSDDRGNQSGIKAIDVLNGLDNSTSGTLLAAVKEVIAGEEDKAAVINYIPSGTTLGSNTEITSKDIVIFGFSYGATVKKDGGNVTSEYLTIWRNAAYKLTGQVPPATLYVNSDYDKYEIITETTVYDFRDGSIIPNSVDGYVITGSPEAEAAPQTDRLKSADGALDYRHIAGDNYHGSTYGLDLKAGSRVFIKPLATSVVKVPLSQYSNLEFDLKLPNHNKKAIITVNGVPAGSVSTYQEILNATAADGNDLQEFITIEYFHKSGQSLEFTASNVNGGSDIYLPYIEVTYEILQRKPTEVLYVTKAGFASGEGASVSTNDPIIRMLQDDENFNVTVVEVDGAGTGVDFTGYDLAIAQETFSSGDDIWKSTGAFGIQNITIPVIYNKTWALRNGKGISSAGATVVLSGEVSVTIDPSNQSNTLFSGIDFSSSNDIRLYNELSDNYGTAGAVGTNAIDVLQNIEISTTGTNLATVSDLTTSTDTSIVINEIPSGTQIGTVATDVLQAPVIAFAFNYGPIIKGDGANISPEALTVWRNAAYKLSGLSVPTTLVDNPAYVPLSIDKVGEFSNVSSNVNSFGGKVYISNVKTTTQVKVYSIAGVLVKTVTTKDDTSFELGSGIWIATVKTEEGMKSVKFVTN
ncbi:T9SS type A sorting domain-containing protein [Wenyingzhuangia sp. chi5]|uniref:T9SS type A sorting domain-containing protein n=1 Tax=Wenyingzhuangia gilva TaxID=3057677 RepID=A0ABT8VTK3_9FLAO|nr:T9SS type A sorting domain-containing protein [Wenyingzhuangia sp. chi5]MDO3695292.1 T9SS type A sorting domain-containing protein [Wenyingzhuangia sp. chi5]